MNVSTLFHVSAAALAVGLFCNTGHAAMPAAPSKQAPSFYRLTAGDTAAEQACTAKGGVVSTDQDGYKICTLARACPAPGGASSATKLNTNDAAAEQKCKDACGVVSIDKDGAKVCTKPAAG